MFVVVAEWRAWLGALGLAARTIDAYAKAIVWAGVLAGSDPRGFTERDVVSVLGRYANQGPSKGGMIRAMKSFYEWACDADVREVIVDPVRRIPVPREKYGAAPSLSPEELRAVLHAAERIDPRARPTLALAYYTGGRVASLCGMLPEDGRRDRDGAWSVHLRVAKGGRPYDVPLEVPEAIEAAKALLDLRDWKPKMASGRRPTLIGVGPTTVSTWAKRAGDLAGVRCWTHLFRHQFATNLEDVDDRTWAEMMSHRDASLRRRYAPARAPRMRGAAAKLQRIG